MLILALSWAIVLLDQVTKEIVRLRMTLGESLPVVAGYFHFTYVRNTGAAWGMLPGFGILLIALSAAMLVLLILFRRHFLTDTLTHRIATGCMVGGIAGNLIDRVRLGYVVDFLDFQWQGHHFPAFNVADSTICIGVGLYILTQFAARTAPAAEGACDGPKPAEDPKPASAGAGGRA
jgi:signal peptidase II